jgi:hypothetical protein
VRVHGELHEKKQHAYARGRGHVHVGAKLDESQGVYADREHGTDRPYPAGKLPAPELHGFMPKVASA